MSYDALPGRSGHFVLDCAKSVGARAMILADQQSFAEFWHKIASTGRRLACLVFQVRSRSLAEAALRYCRRGVSISHGRRREMVFVRKREFGRLAVRKWATDTDGFNR